MTLFMRDREKYAEGMQQERINTIHRMIIKGYSKVDILDLDYTEEEYTEATSAIEAEQMFDALLSNIPTRSIIYVGSRGAGKTTLLNNLQKKAKKRKIFCKYIEIDDKKNFISHIAACSQAFLREVSAKEKIKDMPDKALSSIKSLVISFDAENNVSSLSMQEKELYTSSNLTQNLTEVFESIGKIAQDASLPFCLFIDDIHCMKEDELGSLIAALHRANQLGYPIAVVGAGLPKIYGMLSKAKSYTERLFSYREIGSLTAEQAEEI